LEKKSQDKETYKIEVVSKDGRKLMFGSLTKSLSIEIYGSLIKSVFYDDKSFMSKIEFLDHTFARSYFEALTKEGKDR